MTRSTNMEHVEVLRGIRDWMASIYLDSRVAALDAAIASLSAPHSGDWVLVPREASSEMLTAAIDAHLGFEGEDEVDAVWAAMLSAAEQFGATAGHAAPDVGNGAEGGSRAPTRPAHFPGMFPRQDDPASSSLSHQAVDVGQFRPAVATHQLACRRRVRDCREGLLPTDNLPIYLKELAEANRLLDVVDRAAPQPPAEAQPVAWMDPDTEDVIHDMRKTSWSTDYGVGGEKKARTYTTPLYAHPPPSAPVGAGEVDCRCVDCGGNQPGHDPTCSYMHELHGEAQPVGHGCGDHDHADYIPGCGACAATLPEKRTAQPPSAPVGDDPIDASDNAEYIEHCADRLERLGLRVTAGALRVIAHEHRTLSQQPAAVDEAMQRLRTERNRKLWQADLVGGHISVDRMRLILTAALRDHDQEVGNG